MLGKPSRNQRPIQNLESTPPSKLLFRIILTLVSAPQDVGNNMVRMRRKTIWIDRIEKNRARSITKCNILQSQLSEDSIDISRYLDSAVSRAVRTQSLHAFSLSRITTTNLYHDSEGDS